MAEYKEVEFDTEESKKWERPAERKEPERDENGNVKPVEYRSSMYTDTSVAGDGTDGDSKLMELAYNFCKGEAAAEPNESIVRQCATGKGFNIPAFLLGYIYLLYRRCYIECFGLILASIFIGMLPGYIGAVVIGVVIGFLFPWLYKNKMEKRYNAALSAGLDPIEQLRKAGGTSVPALVIGIIVEAVIIFFYIGTPTYFSY